MARNRETSSFPPALNFMEMEKKSSNMFTLFCSHIRENSQNDQESRNKFNPFCSQNRENGQNGNKSSHKFTPFWSQIRENSQKSVKLFTPFGSRIRTFISFLSQIHENSLKSSNNFICLGFTFVAMAKNQAINHTFLLSKSRK